LVGLFEKRDHIRQFEKQPTLSPLGEQFLSWEFRHALLPEILGRIRKVASLDTKIDQERRIDHET
jgi:hypothetical protein